MAKLNWNSTRNKHLFGLRCLKGSTRTLTCPILDLPQFGEARREAVNSSSQAPKNHQSTLFWLDNWCCLGHLGKLIEDPLSIWKSKSVGLASIGTSPISLLFYLCSWNPPFVAPIGNGLISTMILWPGLWQEMVCLLITVPIMLATFFLLLPLSQLLSWDWMWKCNTNPRIKHFS